MSEVTNEGAVTLEPTVETVPKAETKLEDGSKEKTTRRKREIKQLMYQLVEVVKDGDGDSVIYIPLPIPAGTDTSGKTPIIKAVVAAAAKGDEQYDGKNITVISYPKPQIFRAVPITIKRKVTFDL